MDAFLLVILYSLCVVRGTSADYCVPVTDSNICDYQWEPIKLQNKLGTVCIYIDKTPRKYMDSKRHCQAMGKGDVDALVGLNMGFTSKVHERMLNSGYNGIWMELREPNPKGRSWRWGDGRLAYTNWKNKITPIAGSKGCSILAPFENHWVNVECTATFNVVCQINVPRGTSCPKGFRVVSSTSCIKVVEPVTKRMEFNFAVHYCRSKYQGTLLKLLTKDHETKTLKALEMFNTPWLGLSKKTGIYRWVQAEPLVAADYKEWSPNYQTMFNKHTTLCTKISQDKAWIPANCDDLAPTVCLKDSKVGPGQTQLVIMFHAETNILFEGQNWTARCSARGAQDNKLRWVITRGKDAGAGKLESRYIEEDKFNMSTKTITLPDGVCINMTTSYLMDTATKAAYNGSRISCWAMSTAKAQKCRRQNNSVRKCDIAKPLRVLDGPKGPPELDVIYPGSPGPVLVGSNVTITCEVKNAGEYGKINWVAYQGTTKQRLENIEPPVTVYEKNGNNYSSTISFNMSQSKHFMRVACFAYSSKLADRFLCHDTDIFCKKTDFLKFLKRPKREASKDGFMWSVWSILLVMFVAFAYFMIVITVKIDAWGRAEDEEDPRFDRHHVQQDSLETERSTPEDPAQKGSSAGTQPSSSETGGTQPGSSGTQPGSGGTGSQPDSSVSNIWPRNSGTIIDPIGTGTGNNRPETQPSGVEPQPSIMQAPPTPNVGRWEKARHSIRNKKMTLIEKFKSAANLKPGV